jgi:hypothetical protein
MATSGRTPEGRSLLNVVAVEFYAPSFVQIGVKLRQKDVDDFVATVARGHNEWREYLPVLFEENLKLSYEYEIKFRS